MEQPNFDEEFEKTVADWRERHRLREDDAVLLLVELFRIHQRHWDEVRRREMPSFEQFRADITKLVEASSEFQRHAATLIETLRTYPRKHNITVTRPAAIFAALASLLAGYLIGRVWP